MKFCIGLGPVQSCPKSLHPTIRVEVRGDGAILVTDLQDAKITGTS
jgi:hypothetical protein